MEITELPRSTPRSQPPYHTTHQQSEQLEEIVRKYKAAGTIVPCNSPYAAPALLVNKKTNDKRIVFDYRRLNAQTVPTQYLILHIDDILSAMANATYYTVLDLFSGYLQVKMSLMSVDKTTFVIPTGQFKFLRMPMGLKNAPSVFQSPMNGILCQLPQNIAFCYLDDTI